MAPVKVKNGVSAAAAKRARSRSKSNHRYSTGKDQVTRRNSASTSKSPRTKVPKKKKKDKSTLLGPSPASRKTKVEDANSQLEENDTGPSSTSRSRKAHKAKATRSLSKDKGTPSKRTVPKKASRFYEVVRNPEVQSSDDEIEIDSHGATVSSFDKMFKNIGQQLARQRVTRKALNPVLTISSSSDDEDDSKQTQRRKVEPKTITKEQKERMEYWAQTDKEIAELLNFNAPLNSQPKKVKSGGVQNQIEDIEIDGSDIEVEEVTPTNRLPPDSPSPAVGPLPLIPYCIRVRYKSEFVVFKLVETEYCFEIRRRLAEQVKENAEDLVVCFEDDFEKVFNDRLTLKEAGIKVGTILEAYKAAPGVKSKQKIKDPLSIRIKLQSSQKRSEAFYEIRKTDKFSLLRQLYCTKMSVEPSQVKFSFDGETVDMDDTPIGLDLDGEEVFDVVYT